MLSWFADWPFTRIGWTVLQYLWISTMVIGSVVLSLRLMDRYPSRYRYRLAMGALLPLAILPVLLWMEHTGLMPPIGMADWSAQNPSTGISKQPLFQDLPKLRGLDFGEYGPLLYYWTGLLWTLGVVIMTAYYVISGLLLSLRSRMLPPLKESGICRQIRRLSAELGISAPYRIKEIEHYHSPAVCGIFRPCLLVPARLTSALSKEETSILLAHELLHIKRKDYAAAFLQRLLGAFIFFQPLFWWLNSRLDREREHACDEMAARFTGSRHRYASTLFKIQMRENPMGPHCLNAAENHTLARIRKLALSEEQSLNRNHIWVRSLMTFLVLLTTLFTAVWSAYHLHFIPLG